MLLRCTIRAAKALMIVFYNILIFFVDTLAFFKAFKCYKSYTRVTHNIYIYQTAPKLFRGLKLIRENPNPSFLIQTQWTFPLRLSLSLQEKFNNQLCSQCSLNKVSASSVPMNENTDKNVSNSEYSIPRSLNSSDLLISHLEK